MSKISKETVLSGSILGLALAMGVTAADATPGKSQASDHMSQTAKAKLKSLGFPGNTKDVVSSESKDENEEKDEQEEKEEQEQKEEPQLP